MMKLSWEEYINGHGQNADYDQNAKSITEMFHPREEAKRSIQLMSKNLTLIMLSRSPVTDTIQ